MTKFYKISTIIFISFYFSFVISRVHHSKRRLAWPWMTGKKSALKKSGDTKNIYPEKDYWSQSKNTKEIPALPIEEKLRQVHKHLKQFTPIGLLTSPYTQESQQVKPKIAEPKNVQRNPDTLLKDNEPNGKNQEEKETEIKPENVPWEEVKEWQEENQVADETLSVKWKNKNLWEPDNAQKDIEAWKHTYLKKSERRRPEEEENYDDDMWQEDNSIKEILRWREPTEDIVYKEKYAELSNQGPGNAKKDIPHWKGKKSMIAAPKWKTADHNDIQNKAREQEEDMIIDIDHPNFEMPRKEFDVATFQNATRTKVKEMVAKQLDSFLEDKSTSVEKKKKHSKRTKPQDSKENNKHPKKNCIKKTKGQDSAALCTGQLCHAVQ
nr:golgin subfamily A member 6-like protein 2 [Helicoverpa armigera]